MNSRSSIVLLRTLIALMLFYSAFGVKANTVKDKEAVTQCSNLISFAQPDPVTLDWNDKNDRSIEIISADGKVYQFSLAPNDLGLKDLDGKSVPTRNIINITPAEGKLSNGTQQIRISVQHSAEIKPGTYTGSLILGWGDAKTKACWVRRTIQLVVTDALPLTDKATFLTYRLIPFSRLWWCYECLLPLRPTLNPGRISSLKPGALLAGMKRDESGFAIVSWTGETVLSASGIQQLQLSIGDLYHAGKYDGTLRLNPGDKNADVALTIKASDLVIWPILIIGLGIWLALSVKRYINVKRTIWGLREQEAALGVEYKNRQQSFSATSQGYPYAAYSIAADLDEQRRELLKKIDRLQQTSGLEIDETSDAYKSLLDDLKALEGHIAAWGTFADDLDTLRKELATPAVFGSPISDSVRPALLTSCAASLTGRPITLAEFEDLRKDVSNSIASARVWFSLKSRLDKDVEQLAQLAAKLSQPTDDQKSRLSSIKQRFLVAKTLLWQAGTIDELANVNAVGADLVLGEQELYQLALGLDGSPAPIDGAGSPMTASMTSGVSAAFTDASATSRELLGIPTDDTARERFYARAIRRWDTLIAILAFIIAVLTGLNNLYFEKPFGTLKDYVAIFLWAVGTKLTLDAISTAFGWLFNRPSLQGAP